MTEDQQGDMHRDLVDNLTSIMAEAVECCDLFVERIFRTTLTAAVTESVDRITWAMTQVGKELGFLRETLDEEMSPRLRRLAMTSLQMLLEELRSAVLEARLLIALGLTPTEADIWKEEAEKRAQLSESLLIETREELKQNKEGE